MSKKAGLIWIPILNLVFGLIALIAFFLPYIFMIIPISGYDMAVLGGYAAALVIPVGGIIGLLFGLLALVMKPQAKLFGWLVLIGGLIVLIGAVYIFIQPLVSTFASYGLYLEIIAGILLIVFGLLQALGK